MQSTKDWSQSKSNLNFFVFSVGNDAYDKVAEHSAGPLLKKTLHRWYPDAEITHIILPDHEYSVRKALINYSDHHEADAIFTIGGAGYNHSASSSAVRAVIDKRPCDELMGAYTELESKVLSFILQGGIRGQTIILNCPWSSTALEKHILILEEVLPPMLRILELYRKHLHSFDEAVEIIKFIFQSYYIRSSKNIPYVEAMGYITAKDVKSSICIPSSTISLKTGYGVVQEKFQGKAQRENIKIKNKYETIKHGNYIRIDRGDIILSEVDYVAKLSDVEFKENGDFNLEQINVLKYHNYGENLLRKGSIVDENEIIIQKGTTICPKCIAILKKCGETNVNVYEKPNIGIISVADYTLTDEYNDSGKTAIISFYKKYEIQCNDYGIHNTITLEGIEEVFDNCDIIIICFNIFSKNFFILEPSFMEHYKAQIVFNELDMKFGGRKAFVVCTHRDRKKFLFIVSGQLLHIITINQLLIFPSIMYWMGKDNFEFKKIIVRLSEDVELHDHCNYNWAMYKYSVMYKSPIAIPINHMIMNNTNASGIDILLELPAKNDIMKYIKEGSLCTAIIFD